MATIQDVMQPTAGQFVNWLKWGAALLWLGLCCLPAAAQDRNEPHHELALAPGAPRQLALTLDACMGRFDDNLIGFLIEQKIPATLFVTKRWIEQNPQAAATLRIHADLFLLENHGEKHRPAVIGADTRIFGLAGLEDLAALRREVNEGARAVEQLTGVPPRWFRGATAQYDAASMAEITRLGFRIAGFSVNADAGATLPHAAIVARLRAVRSGDVILAHMNRPASATAAALTEVLPALRAEGYRFVRLDQVDLRPLTRRAK